MNRNALYCLLTLKTYAPFKLYKAKLILSNDILICLFTEWRGFNIFRSLFQEKQGSAGELILISIWIFTVCCNKLFNVEINWNCVISVWNAGCKWCWHDLQLCCSCQETECENGNYSESRRVNTPFLKKKKTLSATWFVATCYRWS